jgi:hypothetical protein
MSDKPEGLDKPVCDCCAFGVEEIRLWEERMMKECGWYIHFVFNQEEAPFKTNIHTHGLKKSFRHKDIQMCIPLSETQAQAVLSRIVERIKAGDIFSVGNKYFNIIQNYAVIFIGALEGSREVIRIIFPDPSGVLDRVDMENAGGHGKEWATQYDI